MKKNTQLIFIGMFLFCSSACSIKQYALRQVAGVMTSQGGGFSTDEDPELVAHAAPFGLKTMEQLAEALPDYRPLRLSLASGFVSYAYAFVQPELEDVEERADHPVNSSYELDRLNAQTQETKKRIQKLAFRARGYALDGLDLAYRGMKQAFLDKNEAKCKAFLAKIKKADVPYLYWAGTAWGLAISHGKDDYVLISERGLVELLIQRAYELDESYDEGALHEIFMAASIDTSKEGIEKTNAHKERALVLSQGRKLSVWVSYAENVLVPTHDRKQFVEVLNKVLETNIDSEDPNWRKNRLPNILAKRRAKKLLASQSDLFLE